MEKYFFGTGRRKTSIAQLKLLKGKGLVKTTDGKEVSDELLVSEIKKPLTLVSMDEKFDVIIKLSGGGISSQRDAALLACSRAISKIDPELGKTLKKEGYLTRDSREKERKKPGLRRARRAPQWAKR